MDNQNIASILKNAINASSSNINGESKQTKFFVLPPELLKGLLTQKETPKSVVDNHTNKAEPSTSKNTKKTVSKKQSLKISKSPSIPVKRPRRSNKRQSTVGQDQKSNTDLKNEEQNDEQPVKKNSNCKKKRNTKKDSLQKLKDNESLGSGNIEPSSQTILNASQEECKELDQELINNSINITPLDNYNKEKFVKSDINEEKCTEINDKPQDSSINEVTSNINQENNLTSTEAVVSNSIQEICDETATSKMQLDENKQNVMEINHEMQDCFSNEVSDNLIPEDNSISTEPLVSNGTTDICDESISVIIKPDEIDEKCIETNHESQVDSIKEVSDNIISENNLPSIEVDVSNYSKEICNETVKVADIKTDVIDQVLEDPHTENSQNNTSQKLETGKILSGMESNDKQEVTDLSSESIQLSNNKETTTVVEETFIVEEIIEIIESDRENAFKKHKTTESFEEDTIQGDEVLPIEKIGLDKTKVTSKILSPKIEPIVVTKRSQNVRVYVNNRKSRIQKSDNEDKEKSAPQITNNSLEDGLINPIVQEVSLRNSSVKLANSQKVEEETNSEVNNSLATEEKFTSDIECNSDANNSTTIPASEIFSEKQCQEIRGSQEELNSTLDCNYSSLPDTSIMKIPIVNACEEFKNSSDFQETFQSEVNHFDKETLITREDSTGEFAVDLQEKSKNSQESLENFTTEKESKSDENSVINNSISIETQCQETKESQEQINTEIDCNLNNYNSAEKNDLSEIQETHGLGTECNSVENNLSNVQAEMSEVEPHEDILTNNIIEKSCGENEMSDSVEKLQDHKLEIDEIQNIESIEKINDIQTSFKHQTEHINTNISRRRSRRKSSIANKDSEIISQNANKQVETNMKMTNNTESEELLTNSNVNNDIAEESTTFTANESKTSISETSDELDNCKDNWENEQDCSIRSLRQLRNRTKVVPRDPEHLNKLKNNIEKESLHFRNNDKSDIIVRYNSDGSGRNRSISLSLEQNSPEKQSITPKKITRKHKSVDYYFGKTGRMIALRRRSAILESCDVKLAAVNEESKKIQIEERFSSDKNTNEPTILSDSTITTDSESIVIPKEEATIATHNNLNDVGLNEKSSTNTDDSESFNLFTEAVDDESNSSFKREKVIVVRKIRKGRRSKSTQSNDDAAIRTDFEKNDNKGTEEDASSKSVDDTTTCDNSIKDGIIQSKTAENANLSEDTAAVEETLSKIKSDKITPAKKGRSRRSTKITPRGNKNRKEIENADGLKEESTVVTRIDNVSMSSILAADKITNLSNDNLDKISENYPIEVENALKEKKVTEEIKPATPAKNARKRKRAKSISLNDQPVDTKIVASTDNLENTTSSNLMDTTIADRQLDNALEEKKIITKKVTPIRKGRRARLTKPILSKDRPKLEKHKEDDTNNKNNTMLDEPANISMSNSHPTNQVIASVEVHNNVPDDLNQEPKCDSVELPKSEESFVEDSSTIKDQKPVSATKKRRGRHPKVTETDIPEANKNSCAEMSTPTNLEVDVTIGDDAARLEDNLDASGIDDRFKEKRSSKLTRRSSTQDHQEKLASNTSNTEISQKDSIEKPKNHGKKSSRIIADSDDEPENIDKQLSDASVRKSERHLKSNINYRVPDEDVDVYDSEKAKEYLENMPKKRRGRPSKKDTLKLNATVEENVVQNQLEESSQKEPHLDVTVDNVDTPAAGVSDTPTRRRRITKGRIINDDIFEVDSEPTKEEEPLEISEQPQTEALSDAASNTHDFEDAQVSDKSEEDDLVEECTPRGGRKRKYVSKGSTARKRGRPSVKNQVESNDDDYTPHHSYLPRAKIVKEKSKESPVKKMIKCGKCEKEIPRSQWYSHNLHSHNDMAWIDGEEKPDFDSDPKLLMRVLTGAHKRKNKKGLVCETCRENKKSVVGFISHITFCGKTEAEFESLLATCEQCGAKLRPSSMEYHERQHRLEAEGKKKKKDSKDKVVNIFEPRSKRKAAEKAVSKISEFTAQVKDEDGGSATKKLKLSSPHIKKFIQTPMTTKKISSMIIAKWKRDVENEQDLACTQLGCEFTCKSFEEMREHYALCNFTATENYVCKVCGFETLFEEEIIKHAVEKHSPEDLDINAAMSGDEASESEDYSDIDEENSNKSMIKKFFYKETSEIENKMFKFIFNNGACHTVLNKTFLSAFQWTLEFERKNFKLSIFNDLTPNVFTLLQEKDADSYLPELNSSMSVKFKNKDDTLSESEWKNWARFESSIIDDCPTFFTGGPIWAIAWAPTPSCLAISDDLSQYLAVSTHSSMDIEYSTGKSYSGKNIIQIWNVGKLNNRDASESEPRLSYVITHEGGTVWSMEWCPSGCYQHEDFPDLKNEGDTNRLGLLAAGCSDGCIRIYSLVFPQDLHDSPEEKQYPIYNTEPVVQLVVSSDTLDNQEQTWQVTKISWSRELDHNVIVGGLSNGYVAFWDLTTKSPMLRYKVNNTTYLRPYRQFFAHHHAVTMVALVPLDNKRYLATGSLDKLYKFWDMEDISKPKNTYKKSYVTDGAWFNNWCCAVMVHDDALCTGHNPTVCLPLRNYTYKYYNLLPSNSTTYGVSTSDFANSVATGNVAGELLALFPHQLLYFRDMEKTIPPKRYYSVVSRTDIVDFEAEETHKSPVKKDKKAKNDTYSDPTKFMPGTYEDSKDRFGIVFNNKINLIQSNSKSKQKYKKKPTLTCEQLQQSPIEQYPLKSINKVAWNPNASSFLWLATGYQNGFVRIIPFRSLASTTEWNKLLEIHANASKSKAATDEESS